MPVYDDEKTENNVGQHDDLGVSPEQRQSEVDALNDSFYHDEAEEPNIQAAEEAAEGGLGQSKADKTEGNKVGSLYKGDDAEATRKSLRNLGSYLAFGSNKRKWMLGGGLGGGVVGLVILLLSLLPLKVMHIVENLQSTFGAAAEQATGEMGERIMVNYLVNKVVPGMVADQKCTSNKIDRTCAVVTPGDGPIAILYNAWRDARIENKLFTNQGIEIVKDGRNFYMRKGDFTLFSGVYDEKNPKVFRDKIYSQMNRKEVRAEIRKAYENETFAKRIMYRFKYGAFLERKFGIKRCLIACNLRDDRADRKEVRRDMWKTQFLQRIITPNTEINGLVLECVFANFDCAKDPGEINDDGSRQTELQKKTVESIRKYVSDGGSLEELNKRVERYKKGGFTKLLLGDLTEKLSVKIGLKALPYIGWIDLGARIFQAAELAGPAAQQINYAVNSPLYVNYYMMYRTAADEVKAGDTDGEMLGSVAQSLGPDAGTDQGGVGAEASPYYQQIMGTSGSTTASLFGGSKVYAANAEVCDDGKTYPSTKPGKATCEEERLDTVRGLTMILNGVSAYANSPFALMGRLAATGWLSTGGKLIDLLEKAASQVTGPAFELTIKAIRALPGGDFLLDKGEDIAKEMSNWFLSWFKNMPFTESISGARSFNIAAIGANVALNDYTHYGLGANRVNNSTMNEIRTAMANEEYDDFKSQSLVARLTDTNSQYSLASKVAMSLPSTTESGLSQSIFSHVLNPASMLSNSFMSLSSKKVSAATAKNIDDAGVTQYAWDLNDPIFSETDYEKYWDEHDCSNPEVVKKWGEESVKNEKTGQYENDKPLGCKLLDTSVRISGAYFTDDLLTAEELGDTSNPEELGAGSKFKIASFNIFHGVDSIWKERLQKSVNVLKSNNVDIVGLQEMRENQFNAFSGELAGDTYDIYPRTFKGKGNGFVSENSIAWNKSKFKLVESKEINFMYFDGGQRRLPQLKLEDISTGQQFYVLNTHDPAYSDNAIYRYKNALFYKGHLKDLQKEGLPIFFTGDFNSGYEQRYGGDKNTTYQGKDENLTYCILTSDGTMDDAFDLSPPGRNVNCPNPGNANSVDHIYVSPGVKVTRYSTAHKGKLNGNGSDAHDTQMADIVIAGANSAESTPYTNPVYKGNTPDPTVIRDESGTYHVFTTGGTAKDPFQHLTSKNLVNWSKGGRVLTAGSVPGWLADERWAPDVAKTGDHYTLTFSGSPSGCGGKRRIGYATAKNAGGPFTYRGELVNNPGDGCGYDIDPKLAEVGGKLILYYGSGNSISAVNVSMKADGSLSVNGLRKPMVLLGSDPNLVEGAWLYEHSGWYYLYYSSGQWGTKSGPNEYRVGVARSRDPFGPYEKHDGPILTGKDPIRGPGHNSVTTDDAGNDWMVYHGWYKSNRSLMIDPITYVNDWPVVNGGNGPSHTQRPGPSIGGLQTTGATDSGGGADFTVASYNMSVKVGAGGWNKMADVVKSGQFDIIGTQELEKQANYSIIQTAVKSSGQYSIYPDLKNPSSAVRNGMNSNSIIWKSGVFDFVNAQMYRYPRNNDKGANVEGEVVQPGMANSPIVFLRYKSTGQLVIVMNIHNAAGQAQAGQRARSGDVFIQQVSQLREQYPETPIVLTGDFNEGTGVRDNEPNRTLDGDYRNLLFCKFASNGLMYSTGGPKMSCPGNSKGGVDYVYATPWVKTTAKGSLSPSQSGSDHENVPYSTLRVPTRKTAGGVTGSVPMQDDYKNPLCTNFRAGGAPGLACDGECVDFVKFRLKKHIDRENFAILGNGQDVTQTLKNKFGYKRDSIPAVNSVVSWPAGGVDGNGDKDKNDPGEHANASAGHTAMVSAVKADGSIVVEEYNATIPSHTYGTRTIPANVARLLTYAHTEVDYQ